MNQAIVDPAIVLLYSARIPLFRCASFCPSVQDKKNGCHLDPTSYLTLGAPIHLNLTPIDVEAAT
uniref:Uncharacterized protein n=1 Tax=Romanomermis culicivorax TaxID=13658 RepID=A0A915KWB6_ROMCU